MSVGAMTHSYGHPLWSLSHMVICAGHGLPFDKVLQASLCMICVKRMYNIILAVVTSSS